MERRSVRPRAGRKALRHSRSRSGVVPLVPRHGEDDLRQSGGQRIAGREISAGAGRSGRQPRSVEPLWRLGLAGDAMAIKRARQTLDAAIALIDPVWGGVYQYSEAGSWTHAHFEKIMSFQAQYLRQYSQAYALWKDPKYLVAARNIERYIADFLTSPEGAFYVSQDADLDHDTDGHKYYALSDSERRKLGMPRIDKNLYARENGWAISGLAAYYNITNDAKALAIAERAAKWVRDNRALPNGGFRHGEKDRGGPYLGDTLAIGQAFLDLYAATGNRDWLTAAAKAGDFVATFRDEAGGFMTSKIAEGKTGVLAKPAKLIDDQVQVARFMNLLNRS